MAPYWRGTPWWWRLLAAYLLIDPSLAVGLDGYERLANQRRAHVRYLGGGVLLLGVLAGRHQRRREGSAWGLPRRGCTWSS